MGIILKDSPQVITRKIVAELFRVVRSQLISIENPLKEDIKELLRHYIEAEDPYHSLKHGTLRGHFGLPAGSASEIVDNIVNEAVSSVSLTENLKIGAKNISGGLRITAIPSDYIDVLSLRDATVITEKGTPLAWLHWLLLLGDTGIVKGYDFVPSRGTGRSGLGVMLLTPTRIWEVPNKSDTGGQRNFRGFPGNNWFTRAIDKMVTGGDFERVVITRLQNAL